mmetsp:Transcript_3393/g.10306  ORF Transcript_3393/g.10306 Transcript_3393/m.10306 type:complete len:219 (-) Transcript_3393:89-745(-)
MRSWDNLRNDARRLEQELEERLTGFSKVYHTLNGDGGAGTTMAPALIQAKSDDIESLLGQLSTVVDSMEMHVGSSSSSVHVFRSHQDILREYKVEYKRTQAKIRSLTEHMDLLRGARARHANGGEVSNEAAMQAERHSVLNATSAADGALSTGWSIQEDLKRQRAMFDSMMSTMDVMRGSMPKIGSLVDSIKRKRKRDVIVLSSVIATGLFITLVWLS